MAERLIGAAWLLAAASVVAVARVHVTAPDAEMRAFVATALLDEGDELAPTATTATHDVVVTASATGLTLRVTGDGERVRTVAGGSPAVMQLELGRRAVGMVALVSPRIATEPPVVALRATSRGDGTAVTQAVLLGLLDAGVGVVPRAPGVDQLCVDADNTQVIMSWGDACEGRAVALPSRAFAADMVREALRLKDAAPLARRTGGANVATSPAPTIAAATSLAPTSPAPSSPPAPTHPAPTTPAPTTPTSPAPTIAAATSPAPTTPTQPALTLPAQSASRAFALGGPVIASVGGGVIGRLLTPDVLVDVGLRWPVLFGVGPSVRVIGTASRPSPQLSIAELAPLAGVQWQGDVFALKPFVAVEVGAWLHGYWPEGANAIVRPSVAAALSAGVRWQPWPWLGCALSAAVGGIPSARLHIDAGTPVWRREAVWLDVGAALTFEIPFFSSAPKR